MRQKSIFSSLTFWGICLSYLNVIVPLIKLGNLEGFNVDFYISLAEASVVFAMSVVGRYNANSIIYTPKGLPGRDKSRKLPEKL